MEYGILTAGGYLVAEAFGAKKIDQARRLACQELWQAGVLSFRGCFKSQKRYNFYVLTGLTPTKNHYFSHVLRSYAVLTMRTKDSFKTSSYP